MKNLIYRLATLTTFLLTAACSTQQWYEAGEDLRCQEYRKHEDPYYKTKCPKTSYEEFERKREEAKQDLNKTN